MVNKFVVSISKSHCLASKGQVSCSIQHLWLMGYVRKQYKINWIMKTDLIQSLLHQSSSRRLQFVPEE